MQFQGFRRRKKLKLPQQSKHRLTVLASLPLRPGVYLFEGNAGEILYIGKAKNVRSRVRSYFAIHARDSRYEKLMSLRAHLCGVSYIEVASEIEALLLEARLIARFRPRFNTQWRDDKLPLYIQITVGEDYPKLLLTRRETEPKGVQIFGPFPSTAIVRGLISQIRRVFPIYTATHHAQRTCLYCHLGRCPGPTATLDARMYHQTIARLCIFLSGKTHQLLRMLSKEMRAHAQAERFEKAKAVKDLIDGIVYVTQPIRHPHVYMERPQLLDEEKRECLLNIAQTLSLKSIPKRIEAYDISNIQGASAAGSLVVMKNGEIDKSQYRRFRIRTIAKPNDVGMLKEVLRRRLKREWDIPDLILVDGGIAQVNIVKHVLSEYDLTIPCVGLAKREETLVFPGGKMLKLKRRDPVLKALQTLRDEAHRFARAYHHRLRQNWLTKSDLVDKTANSLVG